jgi:hypothetical protein
MTALVSPSVLATDRSISPVTTMSVIGSAISAIGVRSSSRKPQLRPVANPSTRTPAPTITTTSAATRVASQDPRRFTVSVATCLPFPQAGGDPYGEGAVESDGGEDQRADDGLLPERVDPQDGQ